MDLALNNLQWLICHKTKPNLEGFKSNLRLLKGLQFRVLPLHRVELPSHAGVYFS